MVAIDGDARVEGYFVELESGAHPDVVASPWRAGTNPFALGAEPALTLFPGSRSIPNTR
jgi:hypothetical protein